MPRHLRLAAAGVLVLLAAACGEVPTAAPSAAQLQRVDAAASIVPGTCTNLAELNTLAATIFTPGSSPNINSVKGKLKNLDKAVKKGDIAGGKAHATEIVAFVLKKHNQGGLSGTDAQVEEFTNKILCFAGFDLEVVQPDNTFLIMPSDLPQVVVNIDGNAGVSFPGNPVTEPTLVEVVTIPDTYADGAGPLVTKLDQYPGFVQIVKTSETNAALAKPVVVGVCASGVIPADVRARLRLGHGAAGGFVVTPAASANFLSCPPPEIADAGAAPLWKRIANAMLPSQLHAFQQEFGGGVGGTVTEFSPFAPVDPELSFGGGVGGTVTEFTRAGDMMSSLKSAATSLLGSCSPIEGATGSPLRDECRPYVQLTTRLGTPFIGVPVTWTVTAGAGSIAPNPGSCGTSGGTALTSTGVSGRTGICWTLGAVGANQVTATPALGGDAIAGVRFSPTIFTFDATANPPAGLVFTTQPPPVVPTDPTFPMIVTVVDKNGERVHAYADRVKLTLNQNTFAGSSAVTSLNAVSGVAEFDISIGTPQTGYFFTAFAAFMPFAAIGPTSSIFEVVPGAPYFIIAMPGHGTTGAVGSEVVPAPAVRVTDRHGNVLEGVPVLWTTVGGIGSVSPASSVTNAAGITGAIWTLGLGENRINAKLGAGRPEAVRFAATGTTP